MEAQRMTTNWQQSRKYARAALLGGVALAAYGLPASAAEYKLTVNRERLMNAQNEPHNWLMMNGDYGSMRYSRLTQINRDNVKNLRMVWALALGGMADVGQNGPENEVNPLVDSGFMYTPDGWGTGRIVGLPSAPDPLRSRPEAR